jgi:flagellar basal-body rod modification protein FlgD
MADVSSITSNQKTIEDLIEEQSKKANASKRNTGELGKDDFLKLLITQVQHQDPMNPQSDTDFIAQMAQFSALEQMQNLNNSFSYSMGFSLLGKYISAQITDDDGDVTYVNGRVESVRMSSGKVVAMVDGKEVPLEKISQVSDTQIGNSGSIMDYTGIIGLLTKTYVTNLDGKKGTIEGIIASVKRRRMVSSSILTKWM